MPVEWIAPDSNREPPGYEPDALTVVLTILVAGISPSGTVTRKGVMPKKEF